MVQGKVSLNGKADKSFRALQAEFGFERVTEDEVCRGNESKKTTLIQLTKNSKFSPRAGVHTFLYEDGMPGLIPMELLYSLDQVAGKRLLRLSQLPRYEWLGARFFSLLAFEPFATAA